MSNLESDISAELSQIKERLIKEHTLRDLLGTGQEVEEEILKAIIGERFGIVARSESIITPEEVATLDERINQAVTSIKEAPDGKEYELDEGIQMREVRKPSGLVATADISELPQSGETESPKLTLYTVDGEKELMIRFGFKKDYMLDLMFFEPGESQLGRTVLEYGVSTDLYYPLENMTQEEYRIASFYLNQVVNPNIS